MHPSKVYLAISLMNYLCATLAYKLDVMREAIFFLSNYLAIVGEIIATLLIITNEHLQRGPTDKVRIEVEISSCL